jgi:hypothetical protein
MVAFGGIGGIVSAVTFQEKQAPKYTLGVAFTLAVNAMTFLCCIGLSFYFRMRNRKAFRDGVVLEGHKDFRYSL